MDKNFYEQDAETLAKELLGKSIFYHGREYMITVTEAYRSKDPFSYVNAYQSGKGHDALIGKDKCGKAFIYGGMLHVACATDKDEKADDPEKEEEYKCGNVLIRGGIRIEKGEICPDDKTKMNYGEGRPTFLCDKLEISTFYLNRENKEKELEVFEIKENSLNMSFSAVPGCRRTGLKLDDKDDKEKKVWLDGDLQFRLEKETVNKEYERIQKSRGQ